ncbi:MAG: hypothetical protein GX660_17870 [Clostridiaceae bacterium]|jgi:hypothetical protein|nr:hypothetical protein [Clostridiaceae bacterium]
MIDSLTLITTAEVPRDILRTWVPPTTYNHDHDGARHYNVYKYQHGGTYSPRVTYTVESRKLKVSIPSLPRFYNGTSAVAIDDDTVPMALEQIERYVLGAGVEQVPEINTWHVASADIYYDFQAGTEIANYMHAFSQIKLASYITSTYGNETVSWISNCRHRDIKFYDRHAKCINQHDDPVTTHFSQGVIRFEVKTRGSDYRQQVEFTDIGHIYKSNVIIPKLRGFLSNLRLNNLIISNTRDIQRALVQTYGENRARILYGFLQAQLRGTTINVHRSTIYRYKRDLKALNIAPVIGIRRLPALEITQIPNTVERLAEVNAYRQQLT